MPVRIESHPQGAVIHVKVVPGASRDKIVGELGDALKVAVSKPPQGGAANDAVIKLLAKQLGIPKANIRIVRGQASPRKEIQIIGLTINLIVQRLGLG